MIVRRNETNGSTCVCVLRLNIPNETLSWKTIKLFWEGGGVDFFSLFICLCNSFIPSKFCAEWLTSHDRLFLNFVYLKGWRVTVLHQLSSWTHSARFVFRSCFVIFPLLFSPTAPFFRADETEKKWRKIIVNILTLLSISLANINKIYSHCSTVRRGQNETKKQFIVMRVFTRNQIFQWWLNEPSTSPSVSKRGQISIFIDAKVLWFKAVRSTLFFFCQHHVRNEKVCWSREIRAKRAKKWMKVNMLCPNRYNVTYCSIQFAAHEYNDNQLATNREKKNRKCNSDRREGYWCYMFV